MAEIWGLKRNPSFGFGTPGILIQEAIHVGAEPAVPETGLHVRYHFPVGLSGFIEWVSFRPRHGNLNAPPRRFISMPTLSPRPTLTLPVDVPRGVSYGKWFTSHQKTDVIVLDKVLMLEPWIVEKDETQTK
jgi:hypothetical protein